MTLITRARPGQERNDAGSFPHASAPSFARYGQRAWHPRLEGAGSGRRQDNVRPVVLRHPVLRRHPGEVPLLPLPALPSDLQDLQAAEGLQVITLRFHGRIVAEESGGGEEGEVFSAQLKPFFSV